MSNVDKLHQLNLNRKRQSQSQRMERCKTRLKGIALKKFTTCFISAIVKFEETFGDLWGYKIPDDQLTELQKHNKIKWEMTRKAILDIGHKQCRSLQAEIDLHTIDFHGYSTKFIGEKTDE